MKVNFDLDDLTNAALKRLVKQLLTASDKDEKKILAKLAKHEASESADEESKEDKERNDLADLAEEMHGKPNTPEVEDDDAFAKKRKKK
jgi:hypothetical protein